MRPSRPTSPPCPAGSATRAAGWTRWWSAPCRRSGKAVRWNSPFYGIEGRGWFLSFHCFTKYVKLTFLNGAALRPLPPVASKHEQVRYFHVLEPDDIDAGPLESWIEQAAGLPGEELF